MSMCEAGRSSGRILSDWHSRVVLLARLNLTRPKPQPHSSLASLRPINTLPATTLRMTRTLHRVGAVRNGHVNRPVPLSLDRSCAPSASLDGQSVAFARLTTVFRAIHRSIHSKKGYCSAGSSVRSDTGQTSTAQMPSGRMDLWSTFLRLKRLGGIRSAASVVLRRM